MPAASITTSLVILSGASEMASSKSPSALLASPLDNSAINERASLSIFGPRPAGPSPRAAGACPRAAALRVPSDLIIMPSFLQAFLRTFRMSFLESGLTMTTRERERSGEMTSKDGFSVVAPIRVIRPDSTWGRKASCWALLKR